jgi:hypothetical protein
VLGWVMMTVLLILVTPEPLWPAGRHQQAPERSERRARLV